MLADDLTLQTRLLRHLGDACLIVGAIARELELSHDQISTAMRKLIARGYARRIVGWRVSTSPHAGFVLAVSTQ